MDKKGFTLIELLAVILILSIVIMIAVYGINRIVANARVGNDVNLVNKILDAAEMYFHSERSDAQDELMQVITPQRAGELNNATSTFFRECELPSLSTNEFNEDNVEFRRSVERPTFASGSFGGFQSDWFTVTVRTLIENGFLNANILTERPGMPLHSTVIFSSCPPIDACVIISRDSNNARVSPEKFETNFKYTIATACPTVPR